jgi:periplasmic protein TonB
MHCRFGSRSAAGAGGQRALGRDSYWRAVCTNQDVHGFSTYPKSAVLTRGLVPSTVAHALLLLWLAFAAPREAPGLRLIALDLEPVPPAPARAPPAAPPAPPLAAPADDTLLAAPGLVSEAPRARGSGRGGGDAPPRAAAARAGQVITAPESAGDTPDALDFSVVQGKADRYAGGVTTSRGTSRAPVHDPGARDEGVRGVVGATGTGGGAPPAATSAPARAPSVDRTRAAQPVSKSWSCPFPKEADAASVDFARARIVVTVGVDGRATSASVVADPGNGFARSAKACALGQRYVVALDAAGRPRVATTMPITVTFTR